MITIRTEVWKTQDCGCYLDSCESEISGAQGEFCEIVRSTVGPGKKGFKTTSITGIAEATHARRAGLGGEIRCRRSACGALAGVIALSDCRDS